MKIEIKKMLEDDSIDFQTFYHKLQNIGDGFWDGINDKEIILQYVLEKATDGISVSHILKAIEDEESEHDLYEIWLGNSMNTPKPINTKQDLLNALEIE